MKIMFVTRSLEYGGAERQLVALAAGLKKRNHSVSVSMLYGGGVLARSLSGSGVQLIDLRKSGRWDVVGFLLHLARILRRERPDIIYGFLPVQNLLVGLLSYVCRPARIVWGVRASGFDLSGYDWLTRLSYSSERRLTGLSDLIIVNSQAGLKHLVKRESCNSTVQVIANGIDIECFQRAVYARKQVRAQWGVDDRERLVGLVARFDPLKDPHTFLRAAATIAAHDRQTKFVIVGDGSPAMKSELMALTRDLGVEKHVVWAGAREDMPAVYSALDLLCLSSISEGFPNVVAEAMACGVRCVVTDVGDAAIIVGDTGLVVPPRQPQAMAAAISKLLDGTKAAALPDPRARILSEYTVDTMVARTEAALQSLLQ